MTIDELRAYCMSLPGTHEKETWGDAEHAGDVTFRVKDKIYVMTGQDGGAVSVRTTIEQQADLMAAFPEAVSIAPYVGRFGWVEPRHRRAGRARSRIVREVIESAWRRTIPKSMLRELEAAGS